MSFPTPHYLLRICGHFGASGTDIREEWSVGLRFGSVGGPTYSASGLQSFLAAAWTPISTFHGGVAARVGGSCYLTHLTGAMIGTDGHYAPASQLTLSYVHSTPLPGASSFNAPWTQCHVLSLRTAQPRGYGSNGRCYYPCGANSYNTNTGRMMTGERDARVNSFVTMVQGLNTAAASALGAGVGLRVYSSVGAGVSYAVTAVRADDKMDTQERRENAFPPSWYVASV